ARGNMITASPKDSADSRDRHPNNWRAIPSRPMLAVWCTASTGAIDIPRSASTPLRCKLRIESKNRLRRRFAQRQTRITRAGGFARIADRNLGGDLGKRLIDFLLRRTRGHVVSLCANSSAKFNAGPKIPSLYTAVTV